jgi:hypothetical protein
VVQLLGDLIILRFQMTRLQDQDLPLFFTIVLSRRIEATIIEDFTIVHEDISHELNLILATAFHDKEVIALSVYVDGFNTNRVQNRT